MLTPQINCLGKMRPVLKFPRHVWGPQIRKTMKVLDGKTMFQVKMSPDCLRVSTHIYGVSKDIDGKMFIFIVKPGMWPLNSIVFEKEPCSEGFNTHVMVSKEIDGKMFILICQVNLGMWPSNWSSWKIKPCSEGFNTRIWGFQGDRWKNVHFQVNLGMWPLKLIFLEKTRPILLVWTHIYGISKEMDGKHSFL